MRITARGTSEFRLVSESEPKGDQPKAMDRLVRGVEASWRAPVSLVQARPQLHDDRALDCTHVRRGQGADLPQESHLAYGGQLVRHGFIAPAPDSHERLAWVETVHLAGKWDNLHAVQVAIGGIVAHDHSGPSFADLSPD